ncbi:MAG TPA: alkaline phosphatase family protein [Mycobacteriales bacterium]|jgi:hypothetical protein|nr:alkaline phosphatase family protein [Mycobacteriales bacterium]
MRIRLLAAVGTLGVALSLGLTAAPGAPAAAATRAASAGALCGSMAGTAPHITKVLWIVMENESYGTGSKAIPGDPSASYIDDSLLSQCGSTSDYHAATHPSYPNYLALTSGSFQNHPSDGLGYFAVPSIFSQIDPSWRSYEEFMPTNCDHTFQTGSDPPSQYYLGRHNPAASYSSLPLGAPSTGDCKTNDVPLGTTSSGALETAVAAGSLPAFSFVTPGLCDDMHAVPAPDTSCPDTVKGGDTWLAKWIPILTSGPDYTSGNLAIDITWDEGRGGGDGEDCIDSQAADCIVPDIVISPYTTHVVSATNLSHYSLLKTTEELLGLPLLGNAADATTTDMCGSFGICATTGPPPPPPPPTSIAFVGAAGTTKNSATEAVAVPAAVTAGDTMVLAATGVSTAALTAPAGWTVVGTEPNPVMTTTVWSKVATAADAGSSVTVKFPAVVKGSLQLAAYSGVSLTAPIRFVGASTHATATSAVTPVVTGVVASDWLASYWTVKSSAVTRWTGPSGAAVRNSAIGTGGGQVSSLLADGGGAAPAGSGGRLRATTDQPFSASSALTMVLTP